MKPKIHVIRKIDEGHRIIKLGNNPLDLTLKQLAEALPNHKINIHIHAMTRRHPQKEKTRMYPSKNFPKLYLDEANQTIVEMPRQWVNITELYEELKKIPEYITPRLRPNQYFVVEELAGHKDVTFQPFPYGWVLTNFDGKPMMEFTDEELTAMRADESLMKLGVFKCPVMRTEYWKWQCPTT